MKIIINLFFFVVLLTLFTGCSIVPYENDFACRLKDNFGKCIPMEEAYDEARTGIEKHPNMRPASEVKDDEEPTVASSAPRNLPVQSSSTDYDNYISGYYKELNKLVDNPVTPMVKQAKTIRTLIVPYSNDGGKTMWGERYAHTIVKEPSFIYGQYMIKKSEKLESLMEFKE